ncbi:MAG TPA: hypothetical protein VKA84_26390, partial [Gemmatimonadaceae bacterium]|nr:hypothetical protein [Gemmatimonadaceae bacterium]
MRTTITDTATAATRRPARAAALVAAAAILAAATSACADRPGPIDPAGARARPPAARASLVDERGYSKLVVDAGDPSLRMLTVEVRGKGIEGALEFKLKGSFGTVAVPAGEGRFIVLRAYDAEGREAYVGETSLDVSPETNPQVEIPLKPAYGGEPLVATVGSYHAVIDPRLTTIEVGRQVELHATVLDPDGWKVELREGASQWLLEDDRDVAFLDIPPSDPLTAYLTVFRPGTFQLVYCYLEVNTCRRQKIEFVPAPPDEYVAVDAGGFHSCGLRKSGRAHCWGDNRFGEAASGRTGGTLAGFVFTQITAGGSYGSLGGFSCALDGAGQAWCWGKNNAGQLGNGATSSGSTAVPQQVAGGFTFTAISAGGAHACGITTAGAAVCWGSNVMGQLGNGTGGTINDFSAAPLAVSANGLTFTSISAGGDHSCGVVT